MFVAASAGLAWACLSTPGFALADDTPNPCDALKRIVAAAPDGFTSLRPDDGKAVAQPYGRDAQCAAKAGTYSCTWTKGATPDRRLMLYRAWRRTLPRACRTLHTIKTRRVGSIFILGRGGSARRSLQRLLVLES
jgi:hypothetical protein